MDKVTRRQQVAAQKLKEKFTPEKTDDDYRLHLPQKLGEDFANFLRENNCRPQVLAADDFCGEPYVDVSLVIEIEGLNTLIENFIIGEILDTE